MTLPYPSRVVKLAVLLVVAALVASHDATAQSDAAAQAARTSMLPASAPTGGAARVARRTATVDYTGGLLHVDASSSSLNQILREIGRLTGMKITGGVQDDRVFGSYGPAPASEVLAKLLDGTSSNFLIVENDSAGPAELILTPRRGGVTPPNPNAMAMVEEQDREPPPPPQVNQQNVQGFFLNGQQQGGGPPGAGGLPPSNGGQTGTPINGGANLGTTPGAFAGFGQSPTDATAQSAANPGDANEPQSPNGVSTPQQIYEQLQKLRQQQQSTPPPQ